MIEMSHGQPDLCGWFTPPTPFSKMKISGGLSHPRGGTGLNVSLLKPLSGKN